MIRGCTCVRLCLLLAAIVRADAQFSGSGSNGSDGALVLTTPGITVFDPRAFNPSLNPAGDNVYHFASIHIGPGVTVKLSSKVLQGPVFWLVQGAVEIEGTLDLNGEDGGRFPSAGGAGGYPGGAAKGRGYGPAGGFQRNAFLVPLVGGDGGVGGELQGGGAGGGALLIASSQSIDISGRITANGGSSESGHGGNGGAIRLVAPIISGVGGELSARGGQPEGANGRIRIEASENRFAGDLNGTPVSLGKPFGLFLPPNPPASVKVVSAGGVAVRGGEVAQRLPKGSPVLLVVEARFIPLGTVIPLEFFTENGTSHVVSTTPLEGTFALSHATVSAALPAGLSHVQVEASWKQPQAGRAQ